MSLTYFQLFTLQSLTLQSPTLPRPRSVSRAVLWVALAAPLSLGLLPQVAVAQGEWSGNLAFEGRVYPQDALFPAQQDASFSVAFEPEYYLDWGDGDQRLVFNPFFRYDSADDERTHADMRELYWRRSFDCWELKIGLAEVFWGVAESQHLVDIINQTDFVENIDGEDKLGQPMVNLELIERWGTLQLFLMPYFRERTFPGEGGRLRAGYLVNTDHPIYESGAEERHMDVALRWSHYMGDWDIGLAHFRGTGRDPLFIASLAPDQSLVLVPYYVQIEQTSLDLQATKGDWLWKLEALYRRGDQFEDYYAFVGGFEYTRVGVLGTASDLGFILEYHYDERQENATTLFQDDLFFALRWARNDIQSTELLAGVAIDAESDALFGNIEASRRIGQNWKLSLQARLFEKIAPTEPHYDFRNDDYVELSLARYF